jgi:uncharacterized protein YcbK (DUF882 family)
MMKSLSRRQILKLGAQAAAAMLTPLPVWAAIKPPIAGLRSLALYNIHTQESVNVCYFKDGRYDQQAIEQINFILRDHRTGDVRPIDRELIDLLHTVSAKIGLKNPFHIISGYRSPKTNAMLHRLSSGVAGKSLHLVGKAIDIRIPQYNTVTLRNLCIKLNCGGVGYYSRSNFVHLDTGRVRTWAS